MEGMRFTRALFALMKKEMKDCNSAVFFVFLSGWQSVRGSELLASLQGMWLGALCPGGETGRALTYPGIEEAWERKKKLSQ